MPIATFDTLKFANTLKAAGVPSAQAEAQAVAFAEVIQLNFKDLATKDDVKASEDKVRQEVKESEQRVMASVDVRLAQVRGELVLVRWMLGVIVGGVIAVLVRLFLFRGPI